MSDTNRHHRLEELLAVLGRLERLHATLCRVLTAKLERIRRSDRVGMQRCASRAEGLVSEIGEQEGRRRQLMLEVGKGLGLSADRASRLTARQLAERIHEPYRTTLQKRVGGLKVTLAQLERINERVDRVSAEILRHLGQAFTTLTAADEPAGRYSPQGCCVGGRPRELFEAFG